MISVEDLREERGNLCEHCKQLPGTQRHHVFFRRSKNHHEYDHKFNLMLVAAKCHMEGKVDAREVREWFWKVQVERYGQEFIDWYESVPTKSVKERYE